ncbi:hypothetical protein FRC00_008451 [Tulasnella sp. 408]|nr:hypothetical protein FRC00_008451 [Tulasnella sp. 408]
MNPPQKEAVAKALSTLMGSVNKENDAQFVFTKTPAAFAPLSSLPDNVEALKLARSRINTPLDTLISCMQRRRNQAAPIHKLPTAVLVMIFAAYNESNPLAYFPCLLDLTTVKKLWYDTIVNSPQLWTVLESNISPKIARLVLQRSKNLPLSLLWHNNDRNENEEEELAEFLEIILQCPERFKSINVVVQELDWDKLNARRLLQANLSQLERLQVKAVWDPYFATEEAIKIDLSNGPPLREIALDTAFLASWSSPRLIGLFTLDLTRPRQSPSVEELLKILSNSPQLELLRLCELHFKEPAGNRPPNTIITLPRLKEIYLENSYGPYLSAILTSAYAPSSKIVRIKGGDTSATVFEEVFSPGNKQLVALLGLGDSGPPPQAIPVSITVEVGSHVARIKKAGDAEEREVALRFSGSLFPLVVDLLGRFFLALSQTPAVELKISPASLIWGDAEFDLLLWSRSLRTLSIHDPEVCRQMLKQLGERTEDSSTGVLTWVCPNLTSIELCYLHFEEDEPESDGLAVEALVRARWSEGRIGEQLSGFTIRCTEEMYPSIWSRGDILKQIMPCVSLSEEDCFN